ncbi:MAG TPA: sugar transferase [Candidatus Saccharimonadales bacterium]|nr:sugar transferase [Candidatus Saccharimonadales bacterium]
MKNNASLLYNFCLVVGDAIAITLAFTVAYILRVSLSHKSVSSPVHAHTYILALVSLLPFWILIFALLGLYNSRVYNKRFSELGLLLTGSFIGILFVISYSYITDTTIFPAKLVTLYGFALAFFFVLLFRTIARGVRRELFSYGIGINNVLIVGDTPVTHELVRSLADVGTTGYRVLGIIGGVKHPVRSNIDCAVFRDFASARHALRNKQLHTIVQTELYVAPADNDEILTYAQEHHIAYRFVPGNSELFVGNIEVDLFQAVPVIAVHQTALTGWGRVVKRLTDLVLGGLLLLIASPFMLLIACAELLSGSGSVFFRQTRLTRFNQKFKVFKFRSQYKKYDGTTPEEAFAKLGRPELIKTYRQNGDFLPDDPRVTPLGRFLRRSSLDELPQLINVVRGDISLVGPRALIPQELDIYAKRHAILSVKSGMTGLAQVSGRRNISFEERRKLDLYYVQNWTFWGDLVILVKTIWIVLFHKGAV